MISSKGEDFWLYCMKKVKSEELIPWWGHLQTHLNTSCKAGPYFMTIVTDIYMQLNPNKITIVDLPHFVSQNFIKTAYVWHEGHTSWIKKEDFFNIEMIIIIIIIFIVYKIYNI